MADHIDRDILVRLVVQRSGEDIETVGIIVDAFLDEIYQAIKCGEGVTPKNNENKAQSQELCQFTTSPNVIIGLTESASFVFAQRMSYKRDKDR